MEESSASGIIGIVVGVIAVASGVIGTLMILVLLMAASPNSSPEQLRNIKLMMLAALVIGALMAIGASILIATGRPWIGSIVGAFPALFVFGGMVYLSIAQVWK